MQTLSTYLFVKISENLTLKEIFNLAQSSKKIYKKIWLNDNFWMDKYLADFGSFSRFISREQYIKRSNSELFGFGCNEYNKLGIKNHNILTMPTKIGLKKIRHFSAGYNHSLVCDIDGKVLSIGSSDWLLLSEKTPRYEEIWVGEKIKMVSAGTVHSLLLSENGNVYSFGMNLWGQLGLGHRGTEKYPKKIDLVNIISVSVGEDWSLALDKEGHAWGFGSNSWGQLGLPTLIDWLSPQKLDLIGIKKISAGKNHGLFLDGEGQVWGLGNNNFKQIGLTTNIKVTKPIKIISEVIDISAGDYHSLFLNKFGIPIICGVFMGIIRENWPIPNLNKIIKISAGGFHNLLIDQTGTLWSYGNNQFGQLGTSCGDTIPQKVKYNVNIKNSYNQQTKLLEQVGPVFEISAGKWHSLILS